MCPICLNNSPNPVSSPLFHYFHCGSWQIIIPFLKLLSQASVTLPSPGSYPTGAQYFCSLFFHQSWDVHTPILSSQPSLFLPLNSLPLALLLLKLFPLCGWLPNNYLKPWHLSRPLSLMRSSQAAVKINKKKVSKRVACIQVGTLSLPQVSCWRWWGHSKEWSFNFKHQVFHAGDWDDAGLRPPPLFVVQHLPSGREVWNWRGCVPLTRPGPLVPPLSGALLGLRVDFWGPLSRCPLGPDYCSGPGLCRCSCPSALHVAFWILTRLHTWVSVYLDFPLRMVLGLYSWELPLVNLTTQPASKPQAE